MPRRSSRSPVPSPDPLEYSFRMAWRPFFPGGRRANTRRDPRPLPARGVRGGRLAGGASAAAGTVVRAGLGLGAPADLGLGPGAGHLGLHRLVRRLGPGADDERDRLAHGRAREARLLHRPRPARPRHPEAVRDLAAGGLALEPRGDPAPRALIALPAH